MVKVAPSLLACDFSCAGSEIQKIEKAGCEYIHLDVMDGVFVPNLSFGPDLIASLRSKSQIVFDTHLMIINPIKYVEAFAKAGSDIITFHVEACENVDEVIDKIHSLGVKAAISVKPKTPIKEIEKYLPKLDMVLIMSVEPGFGGQKFMPDMLSKVKELVSLRKENGYNYEIEIDGGINASNAGEAVAAGVDVLVAGSAVFHADDIFEAVKALKNA